MNNWKIGTRISAGFGAVILMAMALGGFAYSQLRAIEKAAHVVTNESLPGVYTIGQVRGNIYRSMGLLVQHVVADSPSKMAGLAEEIRTLRSNNTGILAQFKKTVVNEKEAAQLETMLAARVPYWAKLDEVLALSTALKNKQAMDMVQTQLKPVYQKYIEAAGAMVESSKAGSDESSTVIHDTVSGAKTGVLIGLGLAMLVAVGISIFVGRSIALPLVAAVTDLEQVAQGDLSRDAPAAFQARGDEIGMLARVQQKMIVNLRAMIGEMAGGIQILAASSTELSSSSAQMTTGSRGASDKAHSVAAAAEEMSSNVTSVAAGMEQTTTNLASVASATEQMTATIGEIAGNSEKARRITGEATRQSARITEQIKQLGQAAHEIGKVTETITEISSQTNLLALNATIEAARAGSAGKGFAVVANEIKALAQQTAAATEDIKTRIAGVQSATSGGIEEIEKVSLVIQEVSDIVASIAAAIEEQATTTKDIARNVTEASQGVADANTRVAETSNVSREIAKDIQFVDHAASDMATGSDHVRTSATELATVAENLKVTASRFHI